MIVYVDELFFKNFFMSYLILIIVNEILSKKYRKRSLMMGSLASSLITVFAVIYELDDSFLIRAITISMMVLLSFKPKDAKSFVVEIAFVLAITFLIGGVMSSSMNSYYEVIFCGAISVLALKKYNDYYKKKKWKIRNQYKLEFEIEKKSIKLNAFLDTGNFLSTNFRDESVIVISQNALKNKVSTNIFNLLQNGEIDDLSFSVLKNVRPINYSVLNEETKMMYGLKVKNIKIRNGGNIIIRDAVIVLSKNDLKESDAIIGISLLEGGMENGNFAYVETEGEEIIC